MSARADMGRQAKDAGTITPPSLREYLKTRSDDVIGALQVLIEDSPASGFWMPVVGSLEMRAGLAPCCFDAQLLVKREDNGLSATIVARTWSVTLAGVEAWVDVEWPSDTMAMWLEGRPVRMQIDFPFLSSVLIVRGSRIVGSFRRFHCSENLTLADTD